MSCYWDGKWGGEEWKKTSKILVKKRSIAYLDFKRRDNLFNTEKRVI
jgi:hypothetical protein